MSGGISGLSGSGGSGSLLKLRQPVQLALVVNVQADTLVQVKSCLLQRLVEWLSDILGRLGLAVVVLDGCEVGRVDPVDEAARHPKHQQEEDDGSDD